MNSCELLQEADSSWRAAGAACVHGTRFTRRQHTHTPLRAFAVALATHPPTAYTFKHYLPTARKWYTRREESEILTGAGPREQGHRLGEKCSASSECRAWAALPREISSGDRQKGIGGYTIGRDGKIA